jgi:hypothetical protein
MPIGSSIIPLCLPRDGTARDPAQCSQDLHGSHASAELDRAEMRRTASFRSGERIRRMW